MKPQLPDDVEKRFLGKCDTFLFEWLIMLTLRKRVAPFGRECVTIVYQYSILSKKKKTGGKCGKNLFLLLYLRQLV